MDPHETHAYLGNFYCRRCGVAHTSDGALQPCARASAPALTTRRDTVRREDRELAERELSPDEKGWR